MRICLDIIFLAPMRQQLVFTFFDLASSVGIGLLHTSYMLHPSIIRSLLHDFSFAITLGPAQRDWTPASRSNKLGQSFCYQIFG